MQIVKSYEKPCMRFFADIKDIVMLHVEVSHKQEDRPEVSSFHTDWLNTALVWEGV